jgi:hypothetical protein
MGKEKGEGGATSKRRRHKIGNNANTTHCIFALGQGKFKVVLLKFSDTSDTPARSQTVD